MCLFVFCLCFVCVASVGPSWELTWSGIRSSIRSGRSCHEKQCCSSQARSLPPPRPRAIAAWMDPRGGGEEERKGGVVGGGARGRRNSVSWLVGWLGRGGKGRGREDKAVSLPRVV